MKRALSILAAGLLLSACGISGNLRYHPGFAAFGSPGMIETDRELAFMTELDIEFPALLFL